jgi:glycosyltransferase involved in cell wall biosynthesis
MGFDLYQSPHASAHPAVSVVLSTYNRFRPEGKCKCLLKRAVDSILNQTFADFELILIDDCSTDTTKDYCIDVATKDPRVQFYRFKENSGVPAKRYNFGMSESRGKYISFMFDDDEWKPHGLAALYEGIKKSPSCGMVYGLATLYRGEQENFTILGGRWGWSKIDAYNFISNNAVILKRSAIDLVGGYDEDPTFVRLCDWDLWWRIGRKFKVGRIKTNVATVYSSLSDSIGVIKTFDWEACRKRQIGRRLIPLKLDQKEPLRCKVRAALFTVYVKLFQRGWLKKMAKTILPLSVYLFFKKIRNSRA